jgi:outer membrane immunogenic protein
MIKFGLLASAGVIAASASAFASDLPRRNVAPVAAPVAAPAFSWTGFYAGVNGGYGWSNQKVDNTPTGEFAALLSEGFQSQGFPLSNVFSLSRKGNFTYGGQAGFNYQTGSLVLGIEADFNSARISAEGHQALSGVFSEGNDLGAYAIDARVKSSVEWFSTLRARVGFTPVDRFLVFATGGLAYGSVKTTASANGISEGLVSEGFSWSGSGNKTSQRFGFAVGGGAEYAITNNVTFKTEYLYVDLGSKTIGVNGSAGFDGAPEPEISGRLATAKSSDRFSVIRAGLNYKF